MNPTMDPKTLKYAKSDEWVSLSGDVATVGITDFAVKALTDLVYIDLPARGKTLNAGEPFGVVESVKAASDMYSPVTGEVIEANTKLADDLGKLSDDPFGAGWLIKVKVADNKVSPDLMDRAAYEKHWASRAH
jgi:glycine cleavage system H protein